MDFGFSLPIPEQDPLEFRVSTGGHLFVLGANGTGKSTLMQRLGAEHPNHACRIFAHRATTIESNQSSFSPAQATQIQTNMRRHDGQPNARYQDSHSGQRTSIAIHKLADAIVDADSELAAACRQKDEQRLAELSEKETPLEILNSIFRQSNIPVEISKTSRGEFFASRRGGDQYPANHLSDGERNALLVTAEVLTAASDTLFLLDEPERHLHRSIISPMLTLLFEQRPDCAFVVSTHDVTLPVDHPSADALLLRDCVYVKRNCSGWRADFLPAGVELDDDIKRDILGARSRILFVEGDENSLDKPLYNLLFPELSVIPKRSCRDVQHSVTALKAAKETHWLTAVGIVDGDNRSAEDCEALKKDGIYGLNFYSVEAAYYHPDVQQITAERHAKLLGGDPDEWCALATKETLDAIAKCKEHLLLSAIDKRARDAFFAQAPTTKSIELDKPYTTTVDVPAIAAKEAKRFNDALGASDLVTLFTHYPIKKTPARDKIASALQFQSSTQYEAAVRTLISEDTAALRLMRSFFGTLHLDLYGNAEPEPVVEVVDDH